MYIVLLKDITVKCNTVTTIRPKGMILFMNSYSGVWWSLYPNSECNDNNYMGIIEKDRLYLSHYKKIESKLLDLII